MRKIIALLLLLLVCTAACAEGALPSGRDRLVKAVSDPVICFLYHWAQMDLDSILDYCRPNWILDRGGASHAASRLFNLMDLYVPVSWRLERYALGGESAVVTVTVMLKGFGSQTAEEKQMNFVIRQEGGGWYVDPESSLKLRDAPEQTPVPETWITQPPQPVSSAEPDMVLYYTPDGGSYYHADANCRSAAARYLPFSGSFTWAEVNDEPYADLLPCPYCDAPRR